MASDLPQKLLLPDGREVDLPVQDNLQWVSPTEFELLRRTDHSVQVGGHNVSADWVVQQLLTQAAVKAVAVRLDTLLTPPRLKGLWCCISSRVPLKSEL